MASIGTVLRIGIILDFLCKFKISVFFFRFFFFFLHYYRRITNLILNHLCDVWAFQTPGRILIAKDPSLIEPSPDSPDRNSGNEEDHGYDYYSDDSNGADFANQEVYRISTNPTKLNLIRV